MADKTASVHNDRLLTNFSLDYKNPDYIWPLIAPMVSVKNRSDKYAIYSKGMNITAHNDDMSPNAMSNEVNFDYETATYAVMDRGLHGYVAQTEMNNADTPLSPLMDMTDFLMNNIWLNTEIRVAAKVFATASYASGYYTTLTGNDIWNSGHADSTPLSDILTAIETPWKRANILVFGQDTWNYVRTDAEILDAVKGATRYQSTSKGIATAEEMLELFGIDMILVGRARYNSAAKGQTVVKANIWGKHMAALYVDPNAGLRSMTFMKSFVSTMRNVYTEFDRKRGTEGSTFVGVTHAADEKVVANDCGYLIRDCVS
jgi:hypothetical protein